MLLVADFWLGSDSVELDESRTTRTSWLGVAIAAGICVASFVMLFFGIGPEFYLSDGVDSISGSRWMNTAGWFLGAVGVPLSVVLAHQVELRRALSPDHIKVESRSNLLGLVLVIGLLVSTLHAFLGSASIKFG
jgi:hypothetical protein